MESMEKRLVIFIIISALILFGTSYIFPPKKTLPVKESAPAVLPPLPAEKSADVGAAPGVSNGIKEGLPAFEEKEIIVDTPLYHAVLTNKGGVIKQWELKEYMESDRTTKVKLLKEGAASLPLALQVKENNDFFLNGFYQIEGRDLSLSGDKKEGTLKFSIKNPLTGQGIEKRLTFHAESYTVDIEIKTENIPSYEFLLGSNFGIHQWGDKNFVGFIGPISLINNRVVKENASKITQDVVYEGKVNWTALEDKYFLSALIPKNEAGKGVIKKVKEGEYTAGNIITPQQPASWSQQFTLFAGPKKLSVLESQNIFLEETIDFGWFIAGSWAIVRVIARPLFSVLNFFHGFTHNYGIAIILLTVSIKTLFIPLTHKSYISMKGLQEIQPLLADLQKKYKNDKQRLNKEIMDLYRTNKINPLGGCLPMVLQIPVFVALFNIFYTTIELRQAPFFLWVTDLSEYDHKYVLPILMGITMFIQQKIQPTNMDPKQAKIMLFLPIIFTFFFLNFSSGLVLYWMVNNILSIGQQVITARYFSRGKGVPAIAEKGSKAARPG
jgi:YidC/Oxa1 family membrane protein insertase